MTFKPNAVKRTLTGTFQRPDGQASEGKIYLALSDNLRGREENVLYTTQEIEIELDPSGSFSEEISVTAPGLTTEEKAELASIEAQRVTNLNDIAAVQELINAYLNKLASNQTVTEQETTDYNTNLATKKSLQETQLTLTTQYLELTDIRDELEKSKVWIKMRYHLTNPVKRDKVTFVLEPGTDPVDISRLPKV